MTTIDVRHYGTIGDGFADDAPAIQAALDAAVPGDVVYFPPDTFRLGRTLQVRTPRLTIKGGNFIPPPSEEG